MRRIVLFSLVTQYLVTCANYYFVTHSAYTNASLNTTVICWLRIDGIRATVTQQCRRNCAFTPQCKAFNIQMLQGNASLGSFNCSLFDVNVCDWQKAALRKVSVTESRLWEKLDASQMKPTPCVEYCAVTFLGNCTQCNRTGIGWTGWNCEIPPRTCSDIPGALTTTLYKVWPWGAKGNFVQVSCSNGRTIMLRTIFDGQNSSLFFIGLAASLPSSNQKILNSKTKMILWPATSAVQSYAKEKKLSIDIDMDGVFKTYTFTDFEIGPKGQLTMTNNENTTAFPPSLQNAPFVYNDPLLPDCGPFWLYDPLAPNISVCDNQRTKLFVFGHFLWDGVRATNYTNVTFSFY